MKTQSSKDKPRSTLGRRLAHAVAVGMLLPVVAFAHPWEQVTMVSQQDVKTLAGTWSSASLSGARTSLVIHKDGSYELTGAVNGKGTIEIAPNDEYIKAGPFDLWLYHTGKSGRHVLLQGDGRGTEVAFGRVHASTAPSMATG